MLKISLIDGRSQRRLVLEGKLIAPWAAELKSTRESAIADLRDRELVIDMRHVVAISQEDENVLLQLVKDGARFHC